VLEIVKYVLFERIDTFVLKRPEKFGGNLEFRSYKELEEAYVAGKVHPMDLKNNVAETLSEVLAPTREYFVRNPKNYDDIKVILAQVKSLR